MLLLETLNGKKGIRPPVWMMRQAGRYLPEYRAIREGRDFLTMVQNPEIAAEITLQPLSRFDLDGAIIFADILTPLIGMGANLTFQKGEGPQIEPRIRTASDIDGLLSPDPRESVKYTLDALKIVRRELTTKPVALLGFCGAPFTLSSYLIEGGSPGDLEHVKALMFSDFAAWDKLQVKLMNSMIEYLVAQVEAGAQALQVFDSWLGVLGPAEYREFVEPYLMQLFSELKSRVDVPLIFFSTGTAGLISDFKRLPIDCLGVDWRVSLCNVAETLDNKFCLQGNLDPRILLAPAEPLEKAVLRILKEGQSAKAHVFNLGHGILQTTPIESVHRVIQLVKGFTGDGTFDV